MSGLSAAGLLLLNSRSPEGRKRLCRPISSPNYGLLAPGAGLFILVM